MPDRSDVEQALATYIVGLLYPEGVGSESRIQNVAKVYRGWPIASALENDLQRGIIHVSVLAMDGSLRDRTRYLSDWQGTVPAATLSASVLPELVRYEGVGGPGQVAGLRVDGKAYAYRTRAGDSASLVAAALAALVRADRPAVAVDNVVHLVAGRGVAARVACDGQGGIELSRQEERFRACLWCPDPAVRDQVASVVATGLTYETFLDVGGWACRLQIVGQSSTDDGAASGLWRRDILCAVEYPTVNIQTLPTMLFGTAEVNSVDWVV